MYILSMKYKNVNIHHVPLCVYTLDMLYVACIQCALEMVADLNSLSGSINRTRDTEDV